MSNIIKYLTVLALILDIFGSLANIAADFQLPPQPTLTIPIIILQGR